PPRPFRCGLCGRSYRHAGSLANHRHSHTTGLFHCLHCPKAFANLMALKNHQRGHARRHRDRPGGG
ncbi:ZN646 protein, partial [Hemiprocne comata]|nr:ZN646 protein [Hemiprocne comata]